MFTICCAASDNNINNKIFFVKMEEVENRVEEPGFSIKIVSEDESALARTATKLFGDENFSECLEHLQKLRLKRPEDPRVTANLAVCKYYIE